MRSFNNKKLVLTGILSGLVFVITSFTKIPSPFVQGAYYHAGDSIIYLSAMVLGAPVAGLVAGLGSFLADLYLGAPVYMFATLIIKGIMGLIAGYFLYTPKCDTPIVRKTMGLVISGLWMMAGYFIYEVGVLALEWRAALLDVGANGLQAVIGIAVFIPLSYSVCRFKKI